MTQLPGNDTTMTQPTPVVSWKPMTLMTQVSKARLRVRARRPGFKSSVMSVIDSYLFFSYDTYDTSFNNEASIRGRTPTRTRPRDLNFRKVVSLCHKRHGLPARSTP